ncbi:hypothetical protein BDF21DRAFT_410003 [Thamnidium elegans]|nr:hypothetical protein BDF21DRAFT_410003 [Thamnidium elegans]
MRPIPKSSYNDATNLLNSGESVREVARKTGISPSTVCRIRKSLKPELKTVKAVDQQVFLQRIKDIVYAW